MSWRAFLSYSRQHYYFAESLALALQQRGLALWFDVQQLEPGSDWKADIGDGLARSECVLLLASKAALASPYVEREWRAALESGKPIVIGVIEAVRLPRELRDMPTLDLRGDFDRAVADVMAVMEQPQATRARAGSRRARFAPGVRRTAGALLVRDAQHVLGALLLALVVLAYFAYSSLPRLLVEGAPEFLNTVVGGMATDTPVRFDLSPLLPALFLMTCALLLVNLLRVVSQLDLIDFLARRFDYAVISQARLRAPGAIIALWGMLALSYVGFMREFFDPRAIPPMDFNLLIFTGVGILLLAGMNALSKRLMPNRPNADVVRFAEMGKVPTEWRANVNGSIAQAVGAPLRAAQGSLTMHLYAEASDAEVVAALRPLVQQLGGQIVAADAPACYDLLILSHASRMSHVREALGGQEGVLGVIASRCNIPAEVQQLRNLQLVDFSRRDANGLLATIGLLTATSDADRMKMQSYRDPVSLNRAAPSAPVQVLALGLLALALLCAVVFVLFLLSGVAGEVLLMSGLALGVCGLVLLLANTAARRGRALLPRPLLLVCAFAPLLTIAVSAFALPPTAVLFGSNVLLFPRGVLLLIGGAALVTGGFILPLLRYPQALTSHWRDAFGMPALPLNPLPALGWVTIAFTMAGVFVFGSE
jgi:hypothetical protein